LWVYPFLTHRLSYIPRESGNLEAVLTFGFFFGLFSSGAIAKRCRIHKILIGVLNVIAIGAVLGLTFFPVDPSGAFVVELFFLFGCATGGVVPLAVSLIDQTHMEDGKHLIHGLIVMAVAVGLSQAGGGWGMWRLEDEKKENPFALAVFLPSGILLLFGFVAVFFHPNFQKKAFFAPGL
jgi:MFS family permease